MKLTYRIKALAAAALCVLTLGGCGMINDDLPACRTEFRLQFVDDYNMKYSDAFAREVKSVSVWVFDSRTGAPVMHTSRSGAALAEDGFYIPLELEPGEYDFHVWGGLEGQSDFTVESENPGSIQELKMRLNATRALSVGKDIGPLFHGLLMRQSLVYDPDHDKVQTLTVPLVKDTHGLKVLLTSRDGSSLALDGYRMELRHSNSRLDWDNSWMAADDVVHTPWSWTAADAVMPDGQGGLTTVESAALIGEITTPRLFADKDARLVITRLSDNTDVINIPLIDYLKLVKGFYNKTMPDQEYLDRTDEWSLQFILDQNGTWNTGGMIYINNWAVVPPQFVE